jgi:hypothetical protein
MLDLARKSAGVVDRAIDLEAVCLGDVKVVRTVAGAV